MKTQLNWTSVRAFSFASAVLFLSACEGIQIGSDALSLNLTPAQAQACRDATRKELARHNIGDDWIRRIHYQAIVDTRRAGSSRLRGFEAWTYPKSGGGVVIVQLTESCVVRGIRAQGLR